MEARRGVRRPRGMAMGNRVNLDPVSERPDPSRPWPIQDPPLPDELLSSWMIRLIWKLGLNPKHGLAGVITAAHWLDADVHARSALARRFGDASGHAGPDIEALRLLSPRSELGGTPSVHAPGFMISAMAVPLGLNQGSTGWVLLNRAGTSPSASPGLCYCPACLRGDNQAYFRRTWRLAFPSSCLRHGLVLQDRCHQCRAAVRPWNIDRSRLDDPARPGDLARCWHCLADLRRAPDIRADGRVHQWEQQIILTWGLATARKSNRLVQLNNPCGHVHIELLMGELYRIPRNRRAFRWFSSQLRHEFMQARGACLAASIADRYQQDWDAASAYMGRCEPVPPRLPTARWHFRPARHRTIMKPIYRPPADLVAWCQRQLAELPAGSRIPLRKIYARYLNRLGP